MHPREESLGMLKVTGMLYCMDQLPDFSEYCGYSGNAVRLTPLHLASHRGDLDAVQCLLLHNGTTSTSSGKVDINAVTEGYFATGATALYVASFYGYLDIVQCLVQETTGGRRANVDATTRNGETALIAASYQGHLAIVQFLQESGRANVDAANKEGWTALYLAACKGHLDIVQFLLERGRANGEARTNTGETALHIASHFGSRKIVQYLVDSGRVNLVNATDEYGWTALHVASRQNQWRIAHQLIAGAKSDRGGRGSRGANVDAADNMGWTALHVAGHWGSLNVVKSLVQFGQANVEATDNDGATALYIACSAGQLELVQYLVETCRAIDINATTRGGETALIAAFCNFDSHRDLHQKYGRLKIVRFLAETCGADVNVTNEKGWTALHHASQKDFMLVAQCLVETGADVNATTNGGETALLLAAQHNCVRTVRYLVERCRANVNIHNALGESALYHASRFDTLDMIQILVETETTHDRAKAHALTGNGQSVLHAAAASANGHFDVVQYLVETCRVNDRIVDASGRTALHIASLHCHFRVVRYLLQQYRLEQKQRLLGLLNSGG